MSHREQMKKIEEKLGRPIEEIKLKEIALSDATLVSTKVHDLVNEGAKWGDPSIGERIVQLHTMDGPLKKYPKFDPTVFDVYHVAEMGKAPMEALEFSSYTLDCTGNRGYHKVNIAVSKAMVKDSQFDVIEANLKRAGEQMGWHLTKEIVDALIANAGNSYAKQGGDTVYDALVTGIGLVREDGFEPDIIVLHPTDEVKFLKLDQFIHALQLDPTGEIRRRGAIGQIFNLTVYSTAKATVGTALVIDADQAYALGVWQDLEVENYSDPLEGLVGAVVSTRYDYTQIWANACAKITSL